MLTPQQIQSIRGSIGITNPKPTLNATPVNTLKGEDLASHYLSLGNSSGNSGNNPSFAPNNSPNALTPEHIGNLANNQIKKPLDATAGTIHNSVQDYQSQIKQGASFTPSNAKGDITQIPKGIVQGVGEITSRAMHAAGDVAGAVTSPFAAFLQAVVPKVVQDAGATTIKSVGDYLANNPATADAVSKLQKLSDSHSDITRILAKDLPDIINAVTLFAGPESVKNNAANEQNLSSAIDKHADSARQIVASTPPEDVESMGGEKALVERFKQNVVDGLKADGHTDAAAKIEKSVNTSGLPSIEEVQREMYKTLNLKTGLPNIAQKEPAQTASGIPTEPSTPAAPSSPTQAAEGGALGGATAVTGRAMKGVAGKLYESAITPNSMEAGRILNYEAKTPFLERVNNTLSGTEDGAPRTRAQTAMEQGLAGTNKMIGVQAKRASASLWSDTIGPALKDSKAVMTKEELFKPIEERILSTVEPGERAGFVKAYEALKSEYADTNSFNLETAQKIKEGLARFIPEKVYKGEPIANDYKTLQNDMAGAIRQKIYSTLKSQNIKQAYLDYGNLKELEDIGVKAITGGGKVGGFGSFWSTIYGQATTPIKTVGGQVLYRVGDRLEFVGRPGLSTFGQYLGENGIKDPNKADTVKQ